VAGHYEDAARLTLRSCNVLPPLDDEVSSCCFGVTSQKMEVLGEADREVQKAVVRELADRLLARLGKGNPEMLEASGPVSARQPPVESSQGLTESLCSLPRPTPEEVSGERDEETNKRAS
jgi:hypothetical protein